MNFLTSPFSFSRCLAIGIKWKAAVLCLSWGLLMVQGIVPVAVGQELPDDPAAGANTARILVASDPPNQAIVIDGRRHDARTPVELNLSPGQYYIVVNADGFQPLSHDVAVASGEQLELEFVLLKTPPTPPTPEELRALSPAFGADDPNSDYWADAGPREMANESCRECHSPILTLHAAGEHRTISCTDCHSALSDHVVDGNVIGKMPVMRGESIQPMCLMCHDTNSKNRPLTPSRQVEPGRHLKQLRVQPHNRCEECHHVHDPMKWVHEAREIVGLPEKMATIPILNEREAYEKRRKYESMAETFFVFPLVPGLIGLTALEGTEELPAELFLYSGLALVLGSYLMGERAYDQELEKIIAINNQRRATNARVKEHNNRVKEAMAEHNRAVELWISESESRGVVLIKEPSE